MAWSYEKNIKIIPGVYLGINKGGIYATIGVKDDGNYSQPTLPAQPVRVPGAGDNIFSAHVQEITTQDMQGVKQAILAAHEQRTDLEQDLVHAKKALARSRSKLKTSYLLLYGFLFSKIPKATKADIAAQTRAIEEIEQQINNSQVTITIEFDAVMREKYNRLVSAFTNMAASEKIWDVTSARWHNRVASRSAASTMVTKTPVQFGTRPSPGVQMEIEALWLENANGADLYIYPGFVIMYASKKEFAVIGLDELQFEQTHSRFVEDGPVPADTRILEYTWNKVNKDGSPDRRFAYNPQIPIVKYGSLALRTSTGLHEEYQLSNYEHTEAFGIAFKDYQAAIKALLIQ